METLTFSLWPVLIAAIASMVFGFLWYSQALFGNLWMKLSGITQKQIQEGKKKGMAMPMLVGFIAGIVTAVVIDSLTTWLNLGLFGEAIYLGFFVWLGFLATTTINDVIWGGKPFKLWILNNAHLLLNLWIMSAVVVLWA
ncbi:MAG: DUF1761 domain-containing protein [Nanoarchaeota archaeon]